MSAADVVQPIVSEITKPLVKLIGQELDYLVRPNKYVNKMNLLVQPLNDNHKSLRGAVEKDLKLGKEIKPEIQLWLESAGEIIARQEKLSEDSKKRCLNGWCVDFGLRYKINKGAVGISERIRALVPPTPDSMSVALPPPPPAVVPDPDFMEFKSTKKTMQQIREALKDAECGIVGIFGMGGIGKTTIVKTIAKEVKKDKRFDQVVMAVVSQSPDLKKIQGQIASMLDLTFDLEADVLGRAGQLHKRLMDLKSILVILDDVWELLELDQIGIPDFVEHNGCKVMLTTRNEGICNSMGSEKYKIGVGVLSEEESWELFKRSAGNSIEIWPELKEVALDVMKECQGLPIALKIVGSALRGKDIGQWESAKLQLRMGVTTNIEGMSKKVISCLRLSYDYLESDEMKACFLICCLFPEDYNIPHEIVVRYATGKGLFWYADRIEKARNLTKTTLQKLKASCLLLKSDDFVMREECFKVHDVVRDVGLFIASEAKLLSRSGPGLGRWLQNNSMEHVKGASFITVEDVSLPGGIHCTELEHLCLFAKKVDYSDAFFKTMKELKVLIHLGCSRLPMSLKCLVSLRTLHLVECKLGDNISAALGELKKLEILTINDTDIKLLPVEVGKLTSLRLLDLRGNIHLKSIPGNVISQLRRLEELYIGASFDDWEIEGTSGDVEKGRSASLSELQSLPCLAILNVCVRDFTSIPMLGILSVSKFAEIPPNLSLPKFVRFDVEVGKGERSHVESYQISRVSNLGRAEFRTGEGIKPFFRLADDDCVPGEAAVGNGKYVLTDLPGGGGLNGLDSLEIEGISWIASLTTANTDKVVFTNLQELILHGVESLTGLASGMGTSGGVLPTGSLQRLKVLEIKWCRRLGGWVFPFSWTHRLHNIEKVEIEESDCCGLFEVKEEILAAADESMMTTTTENNSTLLLLSNLREIRLKHMPRLYALTNGESSSIDFSNLRVVEIKRCLKLDSVFTPNVSQSLVHLERLSISECPCLKMIFEEGDTNSSSSEETTSSTSITFPNLNYVYVGGCKQLKFLFTVSMAKGLLKLEVLYVDDNLKLEEIVCSNKNRAGATEEKEINDAESPSITWPQIRRIRIKNSSYLKRFCLENFFIDMPLLQEFKNINCSDWLKDVASDPPAHGLKIPQSANMYSDV